MAFFEFLASIGETLSSALGKFIKPVGGSGVGDFMPSPFANPPLVDNQTANVAQLDSIGNLVSRAQVLTDEGSFQDDFPGLSLDASLTGTLTFTNGGVDVTGSGTAFTSELNRSLYIKRTTDGASSYTLVAQVLSDTELVLASGYPGTTGSSAATSTKWQRTVGTGTSVSVASGSVTIASGTTNGSRADVYRFLDFPPLSFQVAFSVSQRIANQSFFIGFRDDILSPQNQVGIIIDGTNNTTIKFRSQSGSSGSEITERTVTLPLGLTTASKLAYRVDVSQKVASLTVNGVIAAKITDHLPSNYIPFSFLAESLNTGVPASSTNLVVDLVQLANYNQVQIANITSSDAIPVQIREEVHYISGLLTTSSSTADQEIVTYTVPSGQVAYIVGYSVSSEGNTDGVPVKIGKNTVATPPASPGVVDGNIFRFFFKVEGAHIQEDFSAMPRPIGNAGDVIKMTVTPSGTPSTKWRGTIDLVLRAGS